jgi:hypothetical protein
MTVMQEEGSPLIRTIRTMTEVSLGSSALERREVLLVRLACLIAGDASGTSYLYNLAGPAGPALSAEEVESVLVAAAPLVGTARVVIAAERISEAMGYPISVMDLLAASSTGS